MRSPLQLFNDCTHVPNKRVKDRFFNVTFYQNPFDIVSSVPPIYEKGRDVRKLTGTASEPISYDVDDHAKWITGHTPEEYRQRLSFID